jgi:hypothetical protein
LTWKLHFWYCCHFCHWHCFFSFSSCYHLIKSRKDLLKRKPLLKPDIAITRSQHKSTGGFLLAAHKINWITCLYKLKWGRQGCLYQLWQSLIILKGFVYTNHGSYLCKWRTTFTTTMAVL